MVAFSVTLKNRRYLERPVLERDRSAHGSDGASTLRCGALEILIPRDERGVGTERKRAREMNRVVPAQLELLGQLACLPRKLAIDPDQH